MHIIIMVKIVNISHTNSSLVPRTHPRGGKRVWWLWAKSLVQLMTRGGTCVSQSDCSFSPVIWLTYSCRNVTGPLPTIQIWIASLHSNTCMRHQSHAPAHYLWVWLHSISTYYRLLCAYYMHLSTYRYNCICLIIRVYSMQCHMQGCMHVRCQSL